MYEEMMTCRINDLYEIAERLAETLTSEEMAKEWIITLFKRALELTEEQEKKLHQLGRKVRKKFGMKPIRMEE